MEPSSSSSPKKLKFVPKVPPRRRSERILKTVKRDDDEDTAENERLLKILHEKTHRHNRSSDSTKSPARVAFGGGAPTTYPSSLRPLAAADDKTTRRADDEDIKFTDEFQRTMEQVSSDSEMGEAYIEPWDYDADNYPVVLPLRKPYSGDPEILNKAEFDKAAMNKAHNTQTTNDAKQLHFLDANAQPKLLFFQLPPFVPLPKQQLNSGREVIQISDSSDKKGKGIAIATTKPHQGPQMSATWKDLPSGHVGKLLVYKSGKVKLRMGETLLDVNPGSEGDACEDVMAVNPKSEQLCRLGKVDRHAVISPDVESILQDG